MPLDPSKFSNEIFMPGSQDSRWDQLDNDHASYIIRNMNKTLFDYLGIDTVNHFFLYRAFL